jgi:hypothetical protein
VSHGLLVVSSYSVSDYKEAEEYAAEHKVTYLREKQAAKEEKAAKKKHVRQHWNFPPLKFPGEE